MPLFLSAKIAYMSSPPHSSIPASSPRPTRKGSLSMDTIMPVGIVPICERGEEAINAGCGSYGFE